MRASDILHGLAELLAGLEGQEHEAQPNRAELVAVEVPNVDHTDSGVFVPPLQAKLELLKKSVGVDNVYDQGGDSAELTGHGADSQGNHDQELDRMRHMAGINTVTIDAAADDEPMDA